MRLELPSHLLFHLPGAGPRTRLDTGRPGSPERPGHRVQRRQVHPVRDQPDAAGQGAHRAQVQAPVSGRGCRRGRYHRQARQELSDFISATGGRADSARTSVAGFGRSESSKASWAAKGYEKQQKDAIIIENLRTAAKLPKTAAIHLKPTAINIDSLTFDDAHINQERSHNVSEKQAKQYIRDAKISVTVWNGRFERYYGAEGSAYVRTGTNEIRTAFSRDQYDENTTALVKEMKKNGLLG